jgi:hypothetical protein
MNGYDGTSPVPLDLKLETLSVDLLQQLIAIGSDETATPQMRVLAASIAKVAVNQEHSNRLISLLFECLRPAITHGQCEQCGIGASTSGDNGNT